jgi:hypothetical protein
MTESGSLHPFVGPEPAYGVSDTVAGQVIRDQKYREHQDYWWSISGQRHAKSFLLKLSAEGTVEVLKLNRSQARQVTGLLTRHYHLKGHLSKRYN